MFFGDILLINCIRHVILFISLQKLNALPGIHNFQVTLEVVMAIVALVEAGVAVAMGEFIL
jgi:hypothetical protein